MYLFTEPPTVRVGVRMIHLHGPSIPPLICFYYFFFLFMQGAPLHLYKYREGA